MLIERLRRGLAPVALLGLVLTGTAAGAQPQEAEPTPRAARAVDDIWTCSLDRCAHWDGVSWSAFPSPRTRSRVRSTILSSTVIEFLPERSTP